LSRLVKKFNAADSFFALLIQYAPAVDFGHPNLGVRPMKNWFKFLIILGVLAFTFFGTAAAQKVAVPRVQDRLAMGEEGVKQLLPLMETDVNGNVSKQAYMKFMEAEFRRLDKKGAGQLNAKELTASTVTAARFVGK
jgi:hypothetical protein